MTILGYGRSLFLPNIIKALGYTATTAQLLSVPPNIGASCLILVSVGFSDRMNARGLSMLAECAPAVVGDITLITARQPAVSYYGGTILIAAGVFLVSERSFS